MFKMIFTVKRRAGLSLEEFMAYYNNNHLPLLGAMLPHNDRGPKVFRRNYIRRDDPLLKIIGDDRADASPPFDCIVEIEFERREDAETAMKTFFDPKYLDRIKDDERNFVDPRSIRYYVVEAHEM